MDKVAVTVAKNIEKAVDAEIERLDNLDLTDLETIRKQRLKEIKAREELRKEWIVNGHGQYSELPDEKSFFDAGKKSASLVCHFYVRSSERCKIADMHLKTLAPKHLETRFCYIDAEKCPFLTKKLNISIMPTILCIKNQICVDRIVGFTTLGNRDDFSSEVMEWRLGQADIIECEIKTPPNERKKISTTVRKTIRRDEDGLSDDESD